MGGGAGVAAASVVLRTHVDLLARVSVFCKTCPRPAGAGTVVVTVHVGALVLHIKGLSILVCNFVVQECQVSHCLNLY